MSEMIQMGTLVTRIEELEDKVKHLEEHYNFELRKDIDEENIDQMSLPLATEEATNVLSPLQTWGETN